VEVVAVGLKLPSLQSSFSYYYYYYYYYHYYYYYYSYFLSRIIDPVED
jgi:hypothetical protein